MITQERLRALLDYDPKTGAFTWKTGRRSGMKAGWKEKCGNVVYLRIMIDDKAYMAHRLAHLYMMGRWPAVRIDHKDRNPLNNAYGNLREATASQNAANRTVDRRNKSGHKGVSFYKPSGKWVAHIRQNYRLESLGYFDTKEEAAEAYRTAALERFGEFANCD